MVRRVVSRALCGLFVPIAHTSHDSQTLSGLQKLEQVDTTYSVGVRVSDVVSLPTEPGALLIYDGKNLGGGDT
jgi:hypothetical protein